MSAPPRSQPETDDLYAALIAAHEGLSAEQSARLNARLVLIMMAEHVDAAGFRAALAAACAADGPDQ